MGPPLQLIAQKHVSDADMESLAGTFLDVDGSDWTVIGSPTEVIVHTDRNRLLCHYIPRAISVELCSLAYDCYRKVGEMTSSNRGHAAGLSHRLQTSHYERGEPVHTGILGYFDKANSKVPCRLTQFSRQHFEDYQRGLPFICAMDDLLRKTVPDRHRLQYEAICGAAHDDTTYQIADTAFSTVTVNLDFRTALHKDIGDYKQGFGALAVVSKDISGGLLCFPQYRIAIELGRGDFIAMDVHEWHCNTPIHKHSEDAYRLSFIAYFRERLQHCKDINRRLALTTDTSTQKLIEDIFGTECRPQPLTEGNPKDWIIENTDYRLVYKGKRYRFMDKQTKLKIDNLWPAWEYVLRKNGETT